MKVQQIETKRGKRYILIGDDYAPIESVNRYLKYLDNLNKSPNTQKSYAYDLLLYCRFMAEEGIALEDLCMNENAGPLDILSKFMLWLQYPDYYDGILHFDAESASRSDRSINRIMSTVLEFYQYLAANNKIQQLEVYKMQMISGKFKPFLYELVKHKREVMSSIFKKPVTNPPVEAITRDQYNTLFSLCRSTRDRFLLALLYEGGLRLNEALGLHICDLIDIEDNIIHIVARENNENGARVKLHAEGTIYLPEYVVDLLLEYLNNDLIDYNTDFLFINLYAGVIGFPMEANTVEQWFGRLEKKAGFHVTPHMRRHGFAQEKLEKGWPLEQVQAYLRHKNPTSTEIYAKYTDAMKVKAMKEFLENNDYSEDMKALAKND